MNAAAVANHIIEWLTEYSIESSTSGFVVGVSGGIDSAVTSALVARTGRPVVCLEMPIHQTPAQVSRARNHIDALCKSHPNVNSQEVELTGVFDSFLNTLPPTLDEDHGIALVNARARLRMTTLYYFAQLHGSLVAGTGNKVEDFGVGFFTKYGDGGVDLSPIADLMKSEVYELGKFLGISDEIMKAAPTDGLWGDDRTDEDQIGASYPELEWAMKFVQAKSPEQNLTDRQKDVLAIFKRLNKINQHKMIPIPVCFIPENLR
jgi:NAD+ synthase